MPNVLFRYEPLKGLVNGGPIWYRSGAGSRLELLCITKFRAAISQTTPLSRPRMRLLRYRTQQIRSRTCSTGPGLPPRQPLKREKGSQSGFADTGVCARVCEFSTCTTDQDLQTPKPTPSVHTPAATRTTPLRSPTKTQTTANARGTKQQRFHPTRKGIHGACNVTGALQRALVQFHAPTPSLSDAGL